MSLRVELGLREKRDNGGATYLFAPIPMLSMVCFVFDEPARAGIRRAKLVLKPYEGAQGTRDFKASWEEEDSSSPSPHSSPGAAPHR